MDEHCRRTAVTIARRLPATDVDALARATAGGVWALRRLRGTTGSAELRHACRELETCLVDGAGAAALAGVLLGAGDAWRAASSDAVVDVVWTGPESSVTTSRLTAAVVARILEEARSEILLVGYAVQTEPSVASALEAAALAGVEITLLLERELDNPRYAGGSPAFPGLRARRLAWPAERRPDGGAALHAKILVVDRRTALVGSANITAWAMERNLECGILLRGGPQPAAIHEHVEGLLRAGVVVRS